MWLVYLDAIAYVLRIQRGVNPPDEIPGVGIFLHARNASSARIGDNYRLRAATESRRTGRLNPRAIDKAFILRVTLKVRHVMVRKSDRVGQGAKGAIAENRTDSAAIKTAPVR